MTPSHFKIFLEKFNSLLVITLTIYFSELYISEGKIIKTKLVTQKSKKIFAAKIWTQKRKEDNITVKNIIQGTLCKVGLIIRYTNFLQYTARELNLLSPFYIINTPLSPSRHNL